MPRWAFGLAPRTRSDLLQDKSRLLLAPIRKRRRSVFKVMYNLSAQQVRQTSAGSFTAAVSTTTAVERNLYGLYNKSARIIAGKECHPDICGSAHQASSFCCDHVYTGCEGNSRLVCPDSPSGITVSAVQSFLTVTTVFTAKVYQDRHFQAAGCGVEKE